MGVYTTFAIQPLINGIPFYKCDRKTQDEYNNNYTYDESYSEFYDGEIVSYKQMFELFDLAKSNFDHIKDEWNETIVFLNDKNDIEKMIELIRLKIEELSKDFDFFSSHSYDYSDIVCFVKTYEKLKRFLEKKLDETKYIMVTYG